MTEEQARTVHALISVLAILTYAGLLVYVSRSKSDTRMERARQWLRYYRWRARWDSLPTWKQEALIVRGKGPV